MIHNLHYFRISGTIIRFYRMMRQYKIFNKEKKYIWIGMILVYFISNFVNNDIISY